MADLNYVIDPVTHTVTLEVDSNHIVIPPTDTTLTVAGKAADAKATGDAIGEVVSSVESLDENKVDKVPGKGLSTQDFTTTLKNKLDGIEQGANKTTVDSSLSDSSTNPVQNKVVKAELDGKQATEAGKGLSTEDFTTALKNKLDGIEQGANKTVIVNNTTTDDATEALSAAQGKILSDTIATKLDGSVSNIMTNGFKLLTTAKTLNAGVHEIRLGAGCDTSELPEGLGGVNVQYSYAIVTVRNVGDMISIMLFNGINDSTTGVWINQSNSGTFHGWRRLVAEESTPIATGITGVNARKTGNVINVTGLQNISTFQNGATSQWYTIGNLPIGIRPPNIVFFNAGDNLVGTRSSQIVMCRILTSGELQIWLFANEKAQPFFSVTYII